MNIKKHGAIRTPEYKAWSSMKTRCYSSYYHNRDNYYGRGITVCDRWLNSFPNFLEDMGFRPSKKHSLDRIDNNKGYSKENCRWATIITQQRNKTNTIWVLYKGNKERLCELCERLNLKYNVIHTRIFIWGWNIDEAINKPLKNKPIIINYKGETKSLREWSRKLNMPFISLYLRINRYNMSIEDAFTIPILKGGNMKNRKIA